MIAYSKGNSSGASCATPTGINKVSMTLDALARVESMDYEDPNTPNIQTTYDENGNVKSLLRGGINWLYSYNELNLLEQENLYVDGRQYLQRYEYNLHAFLARTTLPSGLKVNRLMDGLDRTLQIRKGNETIYGHVTGYHANGLISNMRYGNGQIYSQTLTQRQQPLRARSVKGSTVALDYTYSYDARSSITNIDDRTSSNFDQSFTYDALDRLDTATGPWGQGSFKYDALGNIREKTLGARRVTIQYDNRNRAISNTDTANGNRQIRYDNRGNVDVLGDLSFTYDHAQQPTSISGKANGTYQYDGNFKRVKSVVDGKTIYNVYNAAGKLVYVDKVTEGKTTEYIRLNGKNIARVTDGEITYLHKDHLGSPLAGTDDQGNVLWTERYTPFGEKWLNNSANDDLGSYTGHIDDSATGLTYMQARYYDSTIGRFLSIDPVGFRASKPELFNRYSYVSNNPHKYIDPFGLDGTSAADTTEDDDEKKDKNPPAAEDMEQTPGQKHSEKMAKQGAEAMSTAGDIAGAAAPGGFWAGVFKFFKAGNAARKTVKANRDSADNAADAFKNLSKADKARANGFMTQFGNGPEGAKKLLNDINKNGVPKIDDTTKNALQAYRATIGARGGNKAKTVASEVFQTRIEVLDKVLGK